MLKQLSILALFLFCATLSAQEPIRYTTKEGLPSNHIYDIAEDADGFMWFATNRGLVKYDGETFKTFSIQDGLPNNDTWLLELDYHGRLWYFSKSAYQGYIKNDSIYTFSTKSKKVASPRFIYKTIDNLWFAGNLGVQKLNKNSLEGYLGFKSGEDYNKKSLKIQHQHGFNYSLVMPSFANPETKEFIYVQKRKLLIYDWNLNFKREIPVEIPVKYKNYEIQNNGLLYNQIGFFAMGKGVLFIDFKTYKATYKSFKELVGVENTKYFRCFGTKNEIQVSIPGHLMVFDYNMEFKKSYSFPKKLGRISYQDSKGNLWLADFTNGISLIPNKSLQSNYFLKGKKIQKLGLVENQLIAGVNEVGFYNYSREENKFKFLIGGVGTSNGEIYQIKNRPNYLITARKTFIYNNKKASRIGIKPPLELSVNIQTGFKDVVHFNNKRYFITSGSILENFDNTSKFIIYKSGLMNGSVYKNKLFISGSDGLHQLVNDTLIRPTASELIKLPVNSLTATTKHLLIGTDGRGVYIYNEKELVHLKNTDGYSIQKIIKKDNTLWLSTQDGVHKVTLNSEDITSSKITNSFYESDGLLQNNTNDIYIKDSLLFAATDIGIAKINVNSSIYKQQSALYFKTKNDTLNYANGARDNISITFGLQDFVNQENVNYEYRLLPKQKEWTATKTKILNFSNLTPDLYELEVKAIDQHFNQKIVKQYLHVIPTWWQTTVAKIGFGFLSLLGFWLFIRIVKKQIRKSEEAKAQQDKRIAGLELQALRSQMNPHFVHNSLNAIQYFIQRNEVELSENYLSRFSQLIRLFFEYSRRQTVTIKEEIDLLTHYLEIEKLRFEEKLNYTISVCDKIDAEEQLIPSMLLQPIVENAVNHGLFHKKENGLITVSFKQIMKDTFQVIVQDDGIGINKAKAIFKASSKNYQSNSSAVLYERLALLNLSKDWEIAYDINDRSEINKDETGTIVTLTFKHVNS